MITLEPEINTSDVQGHIFPGFGSSYVAIIALKLENSSEGRNALRSLIPQVTCMEEALAYREVRRRAFSNSQGLPDQESAFLAISFSARALQQWGIPYTSTTTDPHFHEGMRVDAKALGDVVNETGIPTQWKFNTREDDRVDMLLTVGHSSKNLLNEQVKTWLKELEPAWSIVANDLGIRREGDKEFFGFRDGISQPAMRGIDKFGKPLSRRTLTENDPRSKEFAKPGQRLVWPGNFLFGYPREVQGPLVPGDTMEPPQPWMANGSYLVYRRLNQDVVRFHKAIESLEEHLTGHGHSFPIGWASAAIVGRWPDGTPLALNPSEADPSIGNDPYQNNNFELQHKSPPTTVHLSDGTTRDIPSTPSDATGRRCPFASHIRQLNPRKGRSEIGQEKHPQKLMLRRGITFGPELEDTPNEERGLLFLSYQTSIADQFRFLQITWANNPELPRLVGVDPIIGQDGTENTQRTIELRLPNGSRQKCPFNGQWVTATGGEYLFAPSLSALRHIVDADELL